jgi:hypothetical protein
MTLHFNSACCAISMYSGPMAFGLSPENHSSPFAQTLSSDIDIETEVLGSVPFNGVRIFSAFGSS